MAKILVTGAKGMLGQDLCPILKQNGYEVFETDINNLDITNLDMVENVLSAQKPDIVIHCAAYTNVDKAEDDPDGAGLINAKGTENIAEICKKIDAAMVYISTDYVFDGNGSRPYKTSDTPNPVNNYGLTKFQGEMSVKNNLEKYYICRTSWLYGRHGKNFVETMLSLRDKPELKVVDDQIGCPTWTVDLAGAIVKILKDKPFSIYHTCGSGYTTWYGFAKEIFKLAGLNIACPDISGVNLKETASAELGETKQNTPGCVNLTPCTTDEFPRPAKRPKYSVMENDGICRDWKLALKDYMDLREK